MGHGVSSPVLPRKVESVVKVLRFSRLSAIPLVVLGFKHGQKYTHTETKYEVEEVVGKLICVCISE